MAIKRSAHVYGDFAADGKTFEASKVCIVKRGKDKSGKAVTRTTCKKLPATVKFGTTKMKKTADGKRKGYLANSKTLTKTALLKALGVKSMTIPRKKGSKKK